jgi:hypothetical protein
MMTPEERAAEDAAYAAKAAERAKASIKAELAATDKDMARIAEEVIGMLVTKNLLTVEEMPDAVKAKIAERAALREQLTGEE